MRRDRPGASRPSSSWPSLFEVEPGHQGGGLDPAVEGAPVREPEPERGLTHSLSIVSSLLVGFILVLVPWWPGVWDVNHFLPPSPLLRRILLSAFTRGAVTGLGLVNILLALYDARAQLAGGRAGR